MIEHLFSLIETRKTLKYDDCRIVEGLRSPVWLLKRGRKITTAVSPSSIVSPASFDLRSPRLREKLSAIYSIRKIDKCAYTFVGWFFGNKYLSRSIRPRGVVDKVSCDELDSNVFTGGRVALTFD